MGIQKLESTELTCRVQFINDIDPFVRWDDAPLPGRPQMHTFSTELPLSYQLPAIHRLLSAPLRLDDSALQVYKDGDLGPYLDLESSLNEQQEDLEGFHTNRKNSIILRSQLSVRVHVIIEKLLNSEGRELRRALFSLKQIFQEDKDLVHEFVQNNGLDCLIRVGADADQNYQNYILRALGQVMLYVDGMNGLMAHNASLQWLYSLVASKFRLVVKTTLKLLLVFVEYVDSNCTLLIGAIEAIDCCQGVPPWTNIMNLLKDYDASDTELLIYTMTLINKCLNGVSDRDTYYNQTDWLEEQGMYNIIQRYMARQGTDLDLLRQFQIYEAVLSHEDGDDHGTSMTQLDESIRRTLRTRKSMGGNSCRRSIRHSSHGTVPNGDVCENGASHYNQAFLQTALSDEQASEDIHAVVHSPDQDVFRDSKETRLTKEKRRLRIQRQREFAKEQNDLWASARKSENENDVQEDETTEGHQLYTSGLQQRIHNGTLGHTGAKDYMSDVTSLNNQLNDLYFDKKVSPRTDMKWMKIRNENGDSNYDDEIGVESATDKKPLLVLSKEQSVKDIAEKLRSPNKTIEEIKFNLAGDLSGLFSKAMEGLKKSKSKGTIKTLEKSEFDATWENIKKSLKRELIINNLDFTDLCEDSEDTSQPLTDNTSRNVTLSGQSGEMNESCQNLINDNSIDLQAPPPPPFSMPPPPPLGFRKVENTQVPPPPPNSLQPRSNSVELNIPANKLKTIKLFWREIPTSQLRKNSFGTVWDELSSVNIDKQKLQILFENKTKETMKKQTDQIKSKELVILDQRRSNAINIALKKLPPSQAIKNAIIKMDNSVLIKEMVEKVLSLIPTEEETIKIQEVQTIKQMLVKSLSQDANTCDILFQALIKEKNISALFQHNVLANPSIPLGTAEQFLITLSSITELNSRLKLWVFKLDFELIEADISEKLFDLKQAMHILKNNSTFKNILSVILTIGGFLNGTGSVKGFQIDYLAKISEVKDTLNKNSLMHTICEVMEKEHQNSSDLYSEIGAVTRAGKINIADICTVINKLEEDCKVSTNCYKRIIKHDTSLTKLKLGDFLTDCLERIVILQVVRRRILIRAKTFLQWLGVPEDSDICENFKIISEFALEYRTTRERVLEQNIRKKAYRERSQTRGKLITENATASEKESLKNILISAPGFSRKRKELLSKGEDASEQLIEDVFTSLLKKGKKSQHKTSNKKLTVKRSRTREGIHEDQQLLT